MKQINSLQQIRKQRQFWHQQGQSVALVSTMGNLHSGHLKLVREARQLADVVVVSIYVNPMQFGANEDLDNYPRTLEADLAALTTLGTTAVLLPTNNDMYPRGLAAQSYVEVPELSDILCGASRPGHFRGVATVVCKLLNMVQPDHAVFGEKDYQQLQVIRTMAADLSLPVQIHGVATEREANGLAKSSRNSYLSAAEQQTAAVLYAQLQWAAEHVANASKDYMAIEQSAIAAIEQAGLESEYFSIRRQDNLQPATRNDTKLVILVAARLGSTRLIDNLQLNLSYA